MLAARVPAKKRAMNTLGSGRPEEIFVGIVALVLAVLMAARVRRADATGKIPLWRKQTSARNWARPNSRRSSWSTSRL